MRYSAPAVLLTIAGVFACIDPPVTQDGPSDAGLPLTGVIAPHAPCIMQEGGLKAADCQAINIVETTIPMVGGGSAIATVTHLTPTPTSLVSATITGSTVFSFTDPACPGATTCTFANQALPYSLGVQCSAPGTPGLLQVMGINGAMDVDSATLTCGAAGPTISVSPGTITPPLMASVGMSVVAPQQITVTNNGTGTLSYTVSNSDPTQWQLINGTCAGFPNCMLAGGGASHTFQVEFTPTTHHTMPVSNTFTFDGGSAGMPTVQVSGTGTGAVLSVTPTDHDFLQLARNALGTQTITITNTGNEPMNVSLSGPMAPFGATATSFANILPGTSRMFDATCQSANAISSTSGSILVMSDAYLPTGGMQNLTLQCEVLATDLQVSPSPVQFGEVRKGSPDRTVDVTLFNASSAMENVTAVSLVGHPNALSRSGFTGGQIPGTTSRTITLKLATGTELDLAGSRLEITVAGQPTPLAVPVQGKVVVPSARVMPARLDLGTACIGSRVAGIVTMVNDGTATLTLDLPTMDEAFVASSSSTFPLELAAEAQLGVEVSPAMMTIGNAKGVLTWPVHALGAPLETFTIPVDLTYIPTGTAVSPAKLEFGQLDVALTSSFATVTLRNCDPDPVTIAVDGLSSVRGPLDAWEIEPASLERTLASQETLTVAARFRPKRTGRHEANIVLEIAGEQRFVNLTGDGIGPSLDKASLYACDCSSSRPWAAWPVGLVLVVVLRRRRRR